MPAVQPWSAAGTETPILIFLDAWVAAGGAESAAGAVSPAPRTRKEAASAAAVSLSMGQYSGVSRFGFPRLHQHRRDDDQALHQPVVEVGDLQHIEHVTDDAQDQHADDRAEDASGAP